MWRYGGNDPYRTLNMLDENYVPLDGRDIEPHRPPYPSRVLAFVYACGEVAEEEHAKFSGASVAQRQMG